jgi:hypothetical protein
MGGGPGPAASVRVWELQRYCSASPAVACRTRGRAGRLVPRRAWRRGGAGCRLAWRVLFGPAAWALPQARAGPGAVGSWLALVALQGEPLHRLAEGSTCAGSSEVEAGARQRWRAGRVRRVMLLGARVLDTVGGEGCRTHRLASGCRACAHRLSCRSGALVRPVAGWQLAGRWERCGRAGDARAQVLGVHHVLSGLAARQEGRRWNGREAG